MYKKWMEEEIKILKDNYAVLSRKKLIDLLPNRTLDAMKYKAKNLKLIWPTPKQRFWKYVDKKSNDKCWNWTGCCDKDGYGHIGVNGKLIRSHRFSWILKNGTVPDEIYVLHKCDNPKCVNPSHLFLGTQQDNIKDKIYKNRQAKGEKNGSSKLTVNQVKQIRHLCREGQLTQVKIGKIFHINQTTVSRICTIKNWRHIQ